MIDNGHKHFSYSSTHKYKRRGFAYIYAEVSATPALQLIPFSSFCQLALLLALTIVLLSAPHLAWATPEHSARSGQGCGTCHISGQGGALTEQGLEYAASGYVWPPVGGYRVLGPIKKPVRFVIGLLHIVSSFIWFGTILYVHLLLKPAYALRGLPRGEVLMGLGSMATVGITGVLLTLSRIKGLSVLVESPWGIVLTVKIACYLTMIGSALAIVAFVGPRLKKPKPLAEIPQSKIFDPVTLEAFDGQEGRAAYIAHESKVYDVTGLKLWRNGAHMKHRAGGDMGEALRKAPHGAEKLEPLTVVGTFDALAKPPLTRPQQIFTLVAYMNLGFVFLVLTVIAYWRWGI